MCGFFIVFDIENDSGHVNTCFSPLLFVIMSICIIFITFKERLGTSMKKLLMLATLCLSVASTSFLQARNKQRIFLTNKYDEDAFVLLTWKNDTFPYGVQAQGVILEKGAENIRIKAPISTYRLLSISTLPKFKQSIKGKSGVLAASFTGNLTGKGMMVYGMATANMPLIAAGFVITTSAIAAHVAYEISTQSRNRFIMSHVHDNTYFVIEQGSKKVKDLNGTAKEIIISAYTSEKSYRENPENGYVQLQQESASVKKELLDVEPFSDEVLLAGIASDHAEALEDALQIEALLDEVELALD